MRPYQVLSSVITPLTVVKLIQLPIFSAIYRGPTTPFTISRGPPCILDQKISKENNPQPKSPKDILSISSGPYD